MKILIGNIFDSKAQTIVNTVNCVGIMGKGIAEEFKKRFPDMFSDYAKRCALGEVRLGEPYLFKSLFSPWIINFPTKDHWRSLSSIKDIERGLDYLKEHCKEWGISSIALPPLGCGNGQLDWRAVGPLIFQKLKNMDISVELYAPYGTPARELDVIFLKQTPVGVGRIHRTLTTQSALNPAWVALMEILYRIEKEPYHQTVGRTIFQKIAYVVTREGLPTGFRYARGSYGPFSRDLKSAGARLINSNLLEEERVGQFLQVKVGSGFEAVRRTHQSALKQWNAIIDKTVDLFMRVNTYQAEVVATVIYAADELKERQKSLPTETEVLGSIMEWKQNRKPPLDTAQVALSIRNLGILGWLQVTPDPSLPMPRE